MGLLSELLYRLLAYFDVLCYNLVYPLKSLEISGFELLHSSFVYDLSTESPAYNLTENAGGLLLQILCIVGLKVLGDGSINVTKTGGNIDGFCSCLDQSRCVGMAEAMCVEIHAFQ